MLGKLFNKYGCDKTTKHKYDKIYEPEFEPLKDQEINILEIGVFKGESTKAFLEYFPNATIYALDIFVRVVPEKLDVLKHPRVKWLQADSTADNANELFKEKFGDVEFDIIIDDGLHTPAANTATFNNFFPMLKDGGTFYVEDVWPLDIMDINQKKHSWLRKHPNEYTSLKMNEFLEAINPHDVTRFDNRNMTGCPDSYIISVK